MQYDHLTEVVVSRSIRKIGVGRIIEIKASFLPQTAWLQTKSTFGREFTPQNRRRFEIKSARAFCYWPLAGHSFLTT